MTSAASALLELERLTRRYGAGTDAAGRKLELLRRLENAPLDGPGRVLRLHECLCFLRAYPDGPEVLRQVRRMLAGFSSRADVRKHRSALADTGIAGTPIDFRFFWPMARWLARRWPGALSIDWNDFDHRDKLREILHVLLPYSETPALDMLAISPKDWIARLKGPEESDAAFLIRRIAALRIGTFARETLYDQLDVPIRIAPGPGTPARTTAYRPVRRVAFQTEPLSRARPDLRAELRRRPRSVRYLSPGAARRVLDLAREAMVTRIRDLDAFTWGNPKDVRLVEWEEGLQFACIGLIPERRLMLEAVYGFLTLKNGVPIGYVLASSLFRSTEVAFNVFDTYRGAEAGLLFARTVATKRHLWGAQAFSIDPYQLGHGNPEGLKSGAWWFYYKMGFRPEDPDVLRVLRAELRRMKANPRHRSTLPTLEKLASEHAFLRLRAGKGDVLGALSVGNVGLRISRLLAERFGADREGGIRTLSREAARLLGVRSFSGFTPGERLAWERWSPLVMALPGIERWPATDRRALARVVRAKGGPRESDYVTLFDAHRRLRRAVAELARDEEA